MKEISINGKLLYLVSVPEHASNFEILDGGYFTMSQLLYDGQSTKGARYLGFGQYEIVGQVKDILFFEKDLSDEDRKKLEELDENLVIIEEL